LAPLISDRDAASHQLWHDVVVARLAIGDAEAHVLASLSRRVPRRGPTPALPSSFVRRLVIIGLAAALLVGCTASKGRSGTGALKEVPVAVRLGGRPDCAVAPSCLPGLRSTYGADLAPGFTPQPSGRAAIDALRAGTIDVAALSSFDPAVDGAGLLVLTDDKGLAGGGPLVPLSPPDALKGYGPPLVQTIEAIGAALTTEDMRAMLAQVRDAQRDPGSVATEWSKGKDAGAFGKRRGVGGPALSIGAANDPESRLIAEAYAQVLLRLDYPASVRVLDGQRDAVLEAVGGGRVALVVDDAASVVDHLTGHVGISGGGRQATLAALSKVAARLPATVLKPAAALRSTTFVVTETAAEAKGISALGDLARLAPAAGEPPSAPALGDLDSALPAEIALGVAGPEVARLQARLVVLGYDLAPVIGATSEAAAAAPVTTRASRGGPRASGLYDEATRRAVAAFQRAVGLPADGVATAATQRALERAEAGKPGAPPAPGTAGTLNPPDAAPPDETTTTIAAPTTTIRGRRSASRATTTTRPRPGSAGVVYLTFVGGPDPQWTSQILDIVRPAGAKATFFVDPAYAAVADPRLVKRMADAGAIGVTAGPHRGGAVADAHLVDRAGAAATILEPVVGKRPTCLRPPEGATSDASLAAQKAAGWTPVLWDIDTQDWRRPGGRAIADATLSVWRSGDVISLHDGGGDRTGTVAAVRIIVNDLLNRGVRMAALPC